MVDALTDGGDSLTIPYRRSTNPPDRPLGSLNFPGKTVAESTKFSKPACLLACTSIVLTAACGRQPR